MAVRIACRLVRVGRIDACVCRAGVVVVSKPAGGVDEGAYSAPALSVVGEGEE